MLRLKRMALPEVPSAVPLFLDRQQTRYWEGGEQHDSESAAEMLGRHFSLPSFHWTMLWNTAVAGYGHLLRSDYLEVWIVSYIVAPKFQGLGIATAFVEEVKGFASNEGIESVLASIHPANLASIRVIEKAGFQITESSKQSEDYLYRLNLQPTA